MGLYVKVGCSPLLKKLKIMSYTIYIISVETRLKKMTLFNIKLCKKITISKDDGAMPIHFNEQDIISCVFISARLQLADPHNSIRMILLLILEQKYTRFDSNMGLCRSVSSIKSFMGSMNGRDKDVVYNSI